MDTIPATVTAIIFDTFGTVVDMAEHAGLPCCGKQANRHILSEKCV